jgi:PAS domain S-box-containing protein
MTTSNSGSNLERKAICIPCKNLAIAAILAWTAIIGASGLWNVHLVRQSALKLAHAEATCNLDMDMVYPRWVGLHGGVYVPVTGETPPNTYLSHLRERDVSTPSGRTLTLINPAYMTRQFHEMVSRHDGARVRITSLKPKRQENSPDPWEEKVLHGFAAHGADGFSEVVAIHGLPYMRAMRPLFVEKSCLVCHESEDYKLGDLCGGLSVSIPMKPFMAVARSNMHGIILGHGFIWILGLTGIGLIWSVNRKRFLEKKLAEEAIKESEQRLADVVNFLPDATLAIDADRKVIVWNRAIEEVTGIPAREMIGRGEYEYMLPFYGERRKHLMDLVWDSDPELEACYPYIRREGDSIISEVFCQPLNNGRGAHLFLKVSPLHDKNGRIVGAIESIRDISDLKRAEETRLQLERQILQTQKLESLGVLAGGIAHDFNNILTAVMGYTGLALMKLSTASPVRHFIREIEIASHRAAELCRQMLDYSGKGRFVIETVHPGALILEMAPLLKASITKKAVLNLNLADNLPPICGDASQMRQIVMNLVINASEAFGDGSGTIMVSTGSRQCTHGYLAETCLSEGLPEGLYTWIEVSDTGCGMDKETLGRIFEPFFTTKFTGRGLGLAAVQGIVRGHNGALRVCSEPGNGTTFRVLFPAAEGECNWAAVTNVEAVDTWQGTGTVLLVDDDETIRVLGKEMIKMIGFHTQTAADGCEALESYRGLGGKIDVVLLDLTMPCMDGVETLRELRSISPDLPVVIASGYAEHDIATRFAGLSPSGFIQKPFTIESLRACLRNALK